MAKTPCMYFVQGKGNRGDKCFYKHEEKGAAATKHTKRTNSPAPKKKKEKDSNVAPCLVASTHDCTLQKFACIAKHQPRAISRLSSDEVSMKRIRFRKNPQVFEIKAAGHHLPVRHRPREYTTV